MDDHLSRFVWLSCIHMILLVTALKVYEDALLNMHVSYPVAEVSWMLILCTDLHLLNLRVL